MGKASVRSSGSLAGCALVTMHTSQERRISKRRTCLELCREAAKPNILILLLRIAAAVCTLSPKISGDRVRRRVPGYRNGGEAIEEGRGSATQLWYSGQVGGIVDAGAIPSPRMMHACMLTWRFRSWAVIVIIIKGRHPCTCVAGLRQ